MGGMRGFGLQYFCSFHATLSPSSDRRPKAVTRCRTIPHEVALQCTKSAPSL